MTDSSEYRKKLLARYETKDSKASYQTTGKQYPQHTYQQSSSRNLTHKASISSNSNVQSPTTSKEMRDGGVTSRQALTQHSLLSGSSSQTDLMKTDMVRRVFYQHKDLQGRHDQLVSEHQKLKQKYDHLMKVSRQLKEKYDELRRKKDRSDFMFSEEAGHSQAASVSADSFEIAEMPLINTFLKGTEQIKHQHSFQSPTNTSMGQDSKQSRMEARLDQALRDKQKLEEENSRLQEELTLLRMKLVTSNEQYVRDKTNLEQTNFELSERMKQLEEDFKTEREKLRNIRLIVGLPQAP